MYVCDPCATLQQWQACRREAARGGTPLYFTRTFGRRVCNLCGNLRACSQLSDAFLEAFPVINIEWHRQQVQATENQQTNIGDAVHPGASLEVDEVEDVDVIRARRQRVPGHNPAPAGAPGFRAVEVSIDGRAWHLNLAEPVSADDENRLNLEEAYRNFFDREQRRHRDGWMETVTDGQD